MNVASDRLSGQDVMLAICGAVCASCDARKKRGCTFCDRCYERLSDATKKRVANGLHTLSRALRDGLTQLED